MANESHQAGEIVSIWVKPAHGKPMQPVDSARLLPGFGLEGGVDCGPTRQVTFIEEERWAEMMAELEADLDPSVRRANVLIRGLDLEESRGRFLTIGGSRLEIRGETRPCRLMDEMHDGLQEAMKPEWRGGAYAAILEGGEIRLGDRVEMETRQPVS